MLACDREHVCIYIGDEIYTITDHVDGAIDHDVLRFD